MTSGETALSSSKGPPGAACTITKVTVMTAKRTGMAVKSLCKIRLNKFNYFLSIRTDKV